MTTTGPLDLISSGDLDLWLNPFMGLVYPTWPEITPDHRPFLWLGMTLTTPKPRTGTLFSVYHHLDIDLDQDYFNLWPHDLTRTPDPIPWAILKTVYLRLWPNSDLNMLLTIDNSSNVFDALTTLVWPSQFLLLWTIAVPGLCLDKFTTSQPD